MRRSCSGSRLLLMVGVLLLAPRAWAASIDITGTNGDPGIDGVAGGGGGPGGPGGDASADATSADADNTATATGGNGGNGGAGSPPGLGGTGGVGGSATANAATVGVPSDPVTANATALGGNGCGAARAPATRRHRAAPAAPRRQAPRRWGPRRSLCRSALPVGAAATAARPATADRLT